MVKNGQKVLFIWIEKLWKSRFFQKKLQKIFFREGKMKKEVGKCEKKILDRQKTHVRCEEYKKVI